MDVELEELVGPGAGSDQRIRNLVDELAKDSRSEANLERSCLSMISWEELVAVIVFAICQVG